ncbi:MAG TPA: hypothetical protein VI455_09485 [Terriglobia bacterium]
MGLPEASTFDIVCPCCNARLTVDARLGRVIGHEAAPKGKRVAEGHRLERAGAQLEKQAERREAHFRESAEEEKIKSQLLERKFEEALKKTRDTPVKPGLRDIDLD